MPGTGRISETFLHLVIGPATATLATAPLWAPLFLRLRAWPTSRLDGGRGSPSSQSSALTRTLRKSLLPAAQLRGLAGAPAKPWEEPHPEPKPGPGFQEGPPVGDQRCDQSPLETQLGLCCIWCGIPGGRQVGARVLKPSFLS